MAGHGLREPATRVVQNLGSDRSHGAKDVVVAGRGLVPLDLGVFIREGDGPDLVVETTSLAEADGAASARRAAVGLVVGDGRAEELQDRGAGHGDRVAVEDAAAEAV